MSCTVADVFRPGEKTRALVYDAAVIIAGSLLIALSAQLKVLLPFSPVPITGQTFAVLILGALLGARRGALCALVYITQGAIGLPVFAAALGPAALLGPTAGFLIGFVPAAYITGKLAEKRWDRRVTTTILAMVLGNIVIYVFGVAWLTWLTNIKTAILTGLCPFVAGDIFKILAAAAILPTAWKLLEKLKHSNKT